MFIEKRNFTLFSSALAAALLLVVSLSTCDSSFGFGEAIDLEPPVLELWKPDRDPSYVRENAELTGSVTDNIAVARVELRYGKGEPRKVLSTATITGDKPTSKTWSITPDFYNWAELLGFDSIDGEKIPIEIVAFDKAGNTGATSIRALSLIIDLSEPSVEDVWITRSSMRMSYLEPLGYSVNPEEGTLRRLEITDPNGEVSANADRYQNGWFWIDARLAENETKIDNVKLQIFDTRFPDTPLLEDDGEETVESLFEGRKRDEGTTVTAPRWTIKEENLIARGAALFNEAHGIDYAADYYINGKRYYYQVVIVAHDKSENKSAWKLEDQDFFVMWERSDVPKGFLDPMIGTQITKGDMLPVEFFDDDSLIKAYTDLFTIDQWRGYTEGSNYANPATAVYLDAGNTLRMPDGSNDDKLAWLLGKLQAETAVPNWKNDRAGHETENNTITELLDGTSPNEKTAFIQTGTKDEDYGEFVLFTLTQDKKLDPHDKAGPNDTNRDRWAGRVWNITIVDDNQPMIIFDTEDDPVTGEYGSPEENTFPRLPDGRHFTIKGYTLRQGDSTSSNKVETLRMAWIPFGASATEQDEKLPSVLAVLENKDGFPAGMPAGVQYWDLPLTDAAGRLESDPAYVAEYEPIGSPSIDYRKQYFSKTFDILGETVGANGWQDFHYNGNLENETKLFVFVAIDNMTHNVNKRLPILGRKTEPKLTVWDISDRDIPQGTTLSPPNIYDFVTSGVIDQTARAAYQTALKAYNDQLTTYDALKAIYGTGVGAEEANALQIYPRGKMLRYWVQAEEAGDLAIQSITLQDITYTTASNNIGYYDTTDSRLSYVETLPENTQKVFRFVATNTLGISRTIQRTVTITSTSMVIDISTLKPDGTYGISSNTNNNAPDEQEDRIAILARFSNMIAWEGDNPPLLNVRYKNASGNYVLRQIPTVTPANTGTLSLDFRFSVPEGAGGELETMYDNVSMPTTTPMDNGGEPVGGRSEINRPITLPANTRIMDISGEGGGIPAFIPGYTSGSTRTETWKTAANSLQDKKNIMLDGVRPNFIVVSAGAYLPVSGKPAYTQPGGGDFYFKSNETITFTLKADKRIQPSGGGNPRIRFYVGDAATGGNQSGPFYATYERSAESNTAMIFTLLLSKTAVTRDGIIITNSANTQYNIALNTDLGGIEDTVGNAVKQLVNAAGVVQANTAVPAPVFPTSPATTVYIDQNAPPAPTTLLRDGNTTVETITGVNTTERNSNVNLNVHINDYTANNTERWPLEKWYSLDDGLSWVQYTGTAGIALTNGAYKIKTRYIDRAGNGAGSEDPVTSKTVNINVEFPKLLGISSTKSDGTYKIGDSLAFNLDFADTVERVTTGADNTILSITLADVSDTTNNTDGASPSYSITINRANAAVAANGKTLTFTWSTNVNGKDMLNGLRITALNLYGLQDKYGNRGPGNSPTTAAISHPSNTRVTFAAGTGVPTSYNVDYNLTKTIVSGIAPAVRTYAPVNAQGRTGNVTTSVSSDNKTITLIFSKPVQRGNGTITIRPHGEYAIPAVMENDGYYLTVTYNGDGTQTETTSTSAGTNSTYVQGMYDIFNAMTSTANKNYLIGGGDLAAPSLSTFTGLSAGPYKKMPHGLTKGAGYAGNYTNTNPGVNAPSPAGSDRMVPDTATKWVLDYRYLIHDATANSAVSNIRTALTSMGYRRQEIAVTSTLNVTFSNDDKTVTITLSEPLLPGLQWDLFYPSGTFSDKAGNPAPAITDGTYWFWSKGIQKPVIRVNRKSSDARTTMPANPNTGGTQTYNPNGYDLGGDNGNTSIGAFNSIAYRIETETKGARIYYGTRRGAESANDAFTGAWTGRATIANPGTNLTNTDNITWNGPKGTPARTTGSWIRNNLIFRNNTSGNNDANGFPLNSSSYTVSANGIAITHYVRGGNGNDDNNRYYGFRSFNRDATETDLSGITLNYSNSTQAFAGAFDNFAALEASKNYIAANARIDHANTNFTTATHTSPKGYEGAFRTVIAIQTGTGSSNMFLCGTNVKSGIPNISGFPAKDGVHNQDTRYMKVFYNGAAGSRNNQYYWISTEIVTPWFMQSYGNGNGNGNTNPNGNSGSYLNAGDSYDWMTAGYGDLSYAYSVNTH